jgi:hypothetical protein
MPHLCLSSRTRFGLRHLPGNGAIDPALPNSILYHFNQDGKNFSNE